MLNWFNWKELTLSEPRSRYCSGTPSNDGWKVNRVRRYCNVSIKQNKQKQFNNSYFTQSYLQKTVAKSFVLVTITFFSFPEIYLDNILLKYKIFNRYEDFFLHLFYLQIQILSYFKQKNNNNLFWFFSLLLGNTRSFWLNIPHWRCKVNLKWNEIKIDWQKWNNQEEEESHLTKCYFILEIFSKSWTNRSIFFLEYSQKEL